MNASDVSLHPAVVRAAVLPGQRMRVGKPAAAEPQVAPAPDAPDDFERGFDDGRAAGWAEGLRLGREQGLQEGHVQVRDEFERRLREAAEPLEAVRTRMRELFAALEAQVAAITAGVEDDLAALAYELVCRVAGAALVSPEGLRTQVQHLLADRTARGTVTIRLHPQDLQWLGASRPQADGGAVVRCEPDPSVALGGCLLAGPAGSLDARLETILAQSKAAILAGRQAREDGP
jgi:flagellar assembly protein FliH